MLQASLKDVIPKAIYIDMHGHEHLICHQKLSFMYKFCDYNRRINKWK